MTPWQAPAAPPPIQVGGTYAVVERPGSGEFRYVVYQGQDARGLHLGEVCPLGIGYIRSSAISFLQQPDAATAAGLKATNQPCGTNAATTSAPGPTTAATLTSAPASTVTAPSAGARGTAPLVTASAGTRGPLVVGQEYAFRNNPQPGQFTTWIYTGQDGSEARLEYCPERGRIGWTPNPDRDLTTPEIAGAEGLAGQNKSCATAPPAVNPEIGKTYAMRDFPTKGQFWYGVLVKADGNRYTTSLCGMKGQIDGFGANRLVTVDVAEQYWGLTANNPECGTVAR